MHAHNKGSMDPHADGGAWLNELPIETSKSAKQSGKGFVDNQLVVWKKW